MVDMTKSNYEPSIASKVATAGGGGIGFAGVLTIAFIVLKLTDYIRWSWVWVLAPIWMPLALVSLVFIFALAMLGVSIWLDRRETRRENEKKKRKLKAV